MIRVVLPSQLRTLAGVTGEVRLAVTDPLTTQRVLDALEAQFPALQGSIRAHGGGPRRRLIRFFVCGEDWSHEAPERLLPDAVASGREAFLIVGAIAGG